MQELDLIRGYLPDGTNPPYQSKEFQPFIPDGVNILHSGAAAVARSANHRAYYDASLFRAIGLSDADVANISSSGQYMGLGGAALAIRDQPNPEATLARVKATHDLLVKLGFKPLACLWGNPTTITTFFPGIRVHDYNHGFHEVRRGVFRIEGSSLWVNPGLALAKHRIMLYEVAGIDIRTKVPFNWDAVAAQAEREAKAVKP